MKLVTFSTLYPNALRPQHGIFVETRLRQLVASGQAEASVVAPVPWFPFRHERFGAYARFARVPREEVRFGLQVQHPRYPLLPRVGMELAPFMLAAAMKPVLGRLLDQGRGFDLIDAHYLYPDGVAAVMLGQYFNKPVVITARGSDVNVLPRYRVPRRLILWAAARARAVVTVCQALKLELARLGVDPQRIVPLRNGVDLDVFRPLDSEGEGEPKGECKDERNRVRSGLALQGFTLLSAGHLVPLKGHDLVIRALAQLPGVQLLIAGSGPQQVPLELLARELSVADRVRFLGALPQMELREVYGAADALVLASSSEGWANVLLESLACGTPVIATNVSGTPEVVNAPQAGILLQQRSPDAIAQAVRALRRCLPTREQTRRHAQGFGWDDTTAGQLALFRHILAGGQGAPAAAGDPGRPEAQARVWP
ncbi:glycosyltransferase family 4 protein [Lacisediminimonas profundi]|uniref:glycosyltransferase family 4 protein n=1 Tax=Lacisediminimonas profundi TaxID=2603856 RepID=UPI00124BC67E|nr:glycosyltransferase family 4 protein [Lacisediminimonas profundi]